MGKKKGFWGVCPLRAPFPPLPVVGQKQARGAARAERLKTGTERTRMRPIPPERAEWSPKAVRNEPVRCSTPAGRPWGMKGGERSKKDPKRESDFAFSWGYFVITGTIFSLPPPLRGSGCGEAAPPRLYKGARGGSGPNRHYRLCRGDSCSRGCSFAFHIGFFWAKTLLKRPCIKNRGLKAALFSAKMLLKRLYVKQNALKAALFKEKRLLKRLYLKRNALKAALFTENRLLKRFSLILDTPEYGV